MAARITVGTFLCPDCQTQWKDEIPPTWTGLLCWPVCHRCGPAGKLPTIKQSPFDTALQAAA